tara:strand:- start:863 stop:2293 length:1431 start_codon:yes stop_codon:yes gene_type:complete
MSATIRKLKAARLACVDPTNEDGFEFVADALYSMSFFESEECPTISIDMHWRVYANPDFVAKLTLSQTVACLVHEAFHNILNHSERCISGRYDPKLYNIAADLEINDLPKLHRLLPTPHLHPFDKGYPIGKLAEWYYEKLFEQQCKEQEEPGQSKPQNGSEDSEDEDSSGEESDGGQETIRQEPGEESGAGEGEGEGEEGESEDSSGGGGDSSSDSGSEDSSGVANGECGSGASGEKKPWELPPPEEGGPPGLDEFDSDILRRRVAQTILESEQARGDLPADMLRTFEEMLSTPKVRWQQHLASAMRSATTWVRGNLDYSYRTLSYRQAMAQPGMIMAGTVSPVPSVMVVLDTSASVSDSDLTEFGTEVVGLSRFVAGSPPRLVSCDSGAGAIQEYRTIQDVKLTGGGGTDMRVGINACLEANPKPNIVIVFTDGGTPWPSAPPPDVKIIACIGGRWGEDTSPEWMDSIRIDENGD